MIKEKRKKGLLPEKDAESEEDEDWEDEDEEDDEDDEEAEGLFDLEAEESEEDESADEEMGVSIFYSLLTCRFILTLHFPGRPHQQQHL